MEKGKPGTTTTPVYVPYATFTGALDALKRDGIPGTGRIDKTLWDTQSGAIQGQLLLALRFLGLIDEHNRVTPALSPLVEASPDDRKPILKRIIEEKYSKLLSLDLATVTPGQLDEAMRSFGVGGSTLIRAIRFFVKACQETGIPISSRVAGQQPGSPSVPRKRRSGGSPRRVEDNQGNHGNIHLPKPEVSGAWEEKLLEKFPPFDPAWPDELKTKWFAGFERLMQAKL
jgi:hypothetical protein